ncbi:MAG: sugar-binding domain-containing protein [Clostridia bacterium]|nr:sugar-binding domain-containing protein [Clostridia bacterium]
MYTEGNRLDLLVKVANMYYRDNLTQQEIAEKLFTSRPTVSRLIRACVSEGIVTIRIRDTSSKREALAERLRQSYGLKKVIIVQSDENMEVTKDRVGEAAARLLADELKEGNLIGISWGTTVQRLLYHMNAHSYPVANVVQILGDTQTHRGSNATHMTLSLAGALNGEGYIMQAPMLVGSTQLKQLLMQEPHMRRLEVLFDRIDIAILGFGGITAPNHAYLAYGGEVKGLFNKVKHEGAVCDLLGAFLDESGNRIATPLDDLTFAMPLERLKRVPLVVGMAAGIKKSRQLLSVLRGGCFNVLIIDEELAKTVPLNA